MSLFRPALPPHPTGPRFWPLLGWTALVFPLWCGLLILLAALAVLAMAYGAQFGPGWRQVASELPMLYGLAVLVSVVPALLLALAVVLIRRRGGWHYASFVRAAVLSMLVVSVPLVGLSVFYGEDWMSALSFPLVCVPLGLAAASLTWRFTLRRKGPAGAEADLAAEAFS